MNMLRKTVAVHAGIVLLAILGGCAERDGATQELEAATAVPPTIVDSILPIEEEVRRFSMAAGRPPAAFESEWSSVEELARDFVQALAAADTVTLARALITPAEFITFYFPHSVFMEPPYQMDPAVVWFQMSSGTSRGLGRALARFSGQPLEMDGYSCDPPVEQGPNVIRERCRVRVDRGDGASLEIRLFGPVMERNGKVKFLSYGNDL